MGETLGLYRSSVGKKIFMALTGTVLFLFVLVHMIGNLKIYQGAEKFDAYAEFLREVGYPMFGHGQLLWIARLGLLFCVGVHIVAAIQLYLQSRKARRVGYKQFDDLSFHYASRWMRWGGVGVLGFVIYHILHLTTGSAHPSFEAGSAFDNVIAGFSLWPASLVYIAAMILLGLHLYHGLWSATQTLAFQAPQVKKWRRPVAASIAIIISAGNISIPLAVLFGWLK
jgi:succinate dehydrogenase / fumarate reductase cytochrome b subunit